MKKVHRINAFARCLAGLMTVLLLSVCVFPTGFAKAAQPEVIKVAFPQATGINEIYEDGSFGGCVYDWLIEISKYTGWKYEFVTGDAGELLDKLENGACDMMGGMFYMENLKDTFNYPKYVMGSNYNLLIYRGDNPDIKRYDYTTLNGKTIGLLKIATAKKERLRKFLEFNNLECNIVEFDNPQDYENCLETGKADIMLGSDVYMKSHYNVAAQFEADPYYIVTTKARTDLNDKLTEAMESIYSADPNFASKLYVKYFPDKYTNAITFTEQERAYLKNGISLKVAVVKDLYPLCYEQEGEEKGIVRDCLELISQRTGLNFTYVYAKTYKEMLNLVVEGKADMTGYYLNNDLSAEKSGLTRTVSYAALDTVIMRNKKSVGKTENLIMAIPEGRDVKPSGEGDTINYYSTYEKCMNAVNNGEADYTQIPAAFVEDLFSRYFYANITLLADTNIQLVLTFALPMPVNVTLYSVLSKSINNFSTEESAHIITNNTLAPRKSAVSLKTLLYSNPAMFIGICIGIVLLICIIVIILNFSRMRTKVMLVKLEKAEETSRAKSDFLSRMSHEIRTPMNAIIGLTNLTRMSNEITPKIDANLKQIDSSAKFLLSLLGDILDMSKIESEKMKIETAPFNLRQLISQVDNMFATQAIDKGLILNVSCELQSPYFIGDKMRIQRVLTNLLSNACKFTDKDGRVDLKVEELERSSGISKLRFSVKDTGIGIHMQDLERIFRAFEQVKDSNQRARGTGLGLAISSSLVKLMGGELQVQSEIGVGTNFNFTVSLPVCENSLSEDMPQAIALDNKLQGLRILLAEDNDLNAEIAIELLKAQKIAVDRAEDGVQAVEMFANSTEGYYDIILMDINMPRKNGLEATKEIRMLKRTDCGVIPILAMTANTFQEDRENAAASGMTGFLPKPFDVEHLYRVILEALQEKINNPKEGKDN